MAGKGLAKGLRKQSDRVVAVAAATTRLAGLRAEVAGAKSWQALQAAVLKLVDRMR